MTKLRPFTVHASAPTAPKPEAQLPHRLVHSPPEVPDREPSDGEDAFSPESYSKPFCEFMTANPTTFHAIASFCSRLEDHGFVRLSERAIWTSNLQPGGKYYCTRNNSSLIAFTVGSGYKSGHGIGIVAGHVDALCAKLKPVSKLPAKAGFVQLGVAPYGGALNSTWWDRDLGIGGRVLVRHPQSGLVESKLVKLDWPIARVPTLAPHFGSAAQGPFNQETQMVPVIGLDNSDILGETDVEMGVNGLPGQIEEGTFAATQCEKLVKLIARELGISDYSSIINWELELFDTQAAQVGGLNKEFIFAGRLDDKLCCYSAFEALLASPDTCSSGIVKMVGMFDDEEIGSLLRQGARSNYMSSVIGRITEAFTTAYGPNVLSQTVANSFLVSSDVIHAVNPNFLNVYLEHHAPRLNVGVAVSADPNGHMTTDSITTALLQRVADKCGCKLQVFQVRNGSRSGGTIGPMTSARIGMRAIDAGIPQLSMHSIRATTGSLDPGLGVKLFKGFFDYFEDVDREFYNIYNV
jgi:aminopeptidase I